MSLTQNTQPTNPGHLLRQSSGHVSTLIHRARHLEQLTTELQNYIRPPLSQHCAVTNFNTETLVLHTDSPVWATQLRYRSPDILKYMQGQRGLETLRTVRIRVLLPDSGPRNRRSQRMAISPATAKLLRDVAASIPDPVLRSALLRLSRH